jgi:hypothetical protein
MTVMFRASYAGYNPKCAVSMGFFDLSGLKGMPSKTAYYPAKPDTKGSYTIKIPIDAYQPGKCNWKIAWVMQAFVKTIPPKKDWTDGVSWGDMIRFGNKHNPQELPGFPFEMKGTSYCGKGGADYCTGGLAGDYVDFVSRRKSYHFIQNIKSKKEKKL